MQEPFGLKPVRQDLFRSLVNVLDQWGSVIRFQTLDHDLQHALFQIAPGLLGQIGVTGYRVQTVIILIDQGVQLFSDLGG